MKIIATLSIVLLLGGCATTYQPQGLSGGFSETQIDTNVFTVTFKGNGYTGQDKANDFTLLRSAELTLEHGFKYFVVVDALQYSKNSIGQTYNISKPRSSNTIICFSEKSQGFSYNAEFIVKSLKQKHGIEIAPNESTKLESSSE